MRPEANAANVRIEDGAAGGNLLEVVSIVRRSGPELASHTMHVRLTDARRLLPLQTRDG